MTDHEPETADYVYGNTRVRARKAALLAGSDYEALIGLDLDGLLGALAGTAYRSEVEAALPRFHGVRRLHEAVRSHLGRSLRELARFYSGAARQIVEEMLSSWDVRNAVTLLRGQAAGASADDVVPLIVPVGRIDEVSAREVARQPEFAAAIDLLVAWQLPTPEDARAIANAWPEYERSADLAIFEHAVVSAHAERVSAALRRFGSGAEPLAVALREENDDLSVLTALRLREAVLVSTGAQDSGSPSGLSAAGTAPQGSEAAAQALLSGASAAAEVLAGAFFGLTRGEVAASVLALPRTDRWQRPLQQWARTGDLVALQDELERSRVSRRLRRFLTGDPLGIDMPMAFATAKETEARNLRILGEVAVGGVDADVARARLVVP